MLFSFARLFSLTPIILRFIHVVADINSLFLFIAEQYSIVCIYHSLFIHSPFDGLFSVFGYYK